MDDPSQTRLEWMRAEFETARRKHLVNKNLPVSPAQPLVSTPPQPAAPPAIVIDIDIEATSKTTGLPTKPLNLPKS